MARGTRAGHVGLSSRHALALVHHGGGSTAELIALSRLYVPYGFNFAAFVTPDAGVVSFKQLFGASWEVGLRVNLPRT